MIGTNKTLDDERSLFHAFWIFFCNRMRMILILSQFIEHDQKLGIWNHVAKKLLHYIKLADFGIDIKKFTRFLYLTPPNVAWIAVSACRQSFLSVVILW